MSDKEICALCSMELSTSPLHSGENSFCCAGCHAVFNILEAKNQLQSYAEHPVFKQAVRSGLISNPYLLDHIRQSQSENPQEERQKLHLEINNMWCPSCAEIIRLVLMKQKGIYNCIVDYSTDLASIEFIPRYLSKEKIYELIRNLGYQPTSLETSERKPVSSDLYMRFIIAAFCSLNVMMLAYPLYATYFNYDNEGYGALFAWLSMIISLPVLVYSAQPIVKRFLACCKARIFGMESLVILGVFAAFGLSVYELSLGGTKVYFDSMTVIVVFVLLGKIIESRAKFSAKEAMVHLERATPRRGRKRFEDGTSQFVPVKDIQKGDVVIVHTGEKIVLDGIIIEGEGLCDESLMTGEAVPVFKSIGSQMLSGTILQNGQIAFRVQSGIMESALHKIIEMIEKDINGKALYARAADSIVRWFVPVVLLIAFLTAGICLGFGITDGEKNVIQTSILRGVAVLLISCPCAIGIAAPLAESHLLNRLALIGAIVRNKACLPFLGKESVFIFDKTGTITKGRFSVLSGLESLTVLQHAILHTLSSCSSHPVSSAVSGATKGTVVLDRVEEVAGRGVRGIYEGQCYILGSFTFLKEQGVEPIDLLGSQQELTSIVYFAEAKKCLTALLLGDEVREEAESLLMQLKPAYTVLLSGDSQVSVEKVASVCHFDAYEFGQTPLQKREYVLKHKQKGAVVCMIGDGINDAPALTAADVSISVVSASDMSIQVSDILLTTDKLTTLLSIRNLAKKGQKILKQNLFWAFFYNIMGIILAAFGLLSPIFAAFAMSASSLIVLFNARRLSR